MRLETMHRIDVLVTTEPTGGIEPFRHGDIHIAIHPWSGIEAPPLLSGRLRLFIDWELPAISGLEVCRRVRSNPAITQAHVTIVLDAQDSQARSLALRAGADDYMPGPLSRRSLLDRILSAEGQGQDFGMAEIVLGNLTVDIAAYRAKWHDLAIPLMPNEFQLLRFFAEHPGRVFSRTQLIAALGKHDPPLDERTVDVWIGRLRRALRTAGVTESVRTVRSLGYVLDAP